MRSTGNVNDANAPAPSSGDGGRSGDSAGASGALVAMRFDLLCKRVFGHERMMLDSSVWFLDPKTWSLLDWSTLVEVSPEHVSELNVSRRSDLVWSVRKKDGTARMYFLLEFQSRVDRSMALRMGEGQVMLLAKASRDGADVPAVLPFVIYTGKGKWNAPRSLGDLYSDWPADVRAWLARTRYQVVELLRYRGRGLNGEGNFASSLFRLLAAKTPDDLERELRAMESMATDRQTRKLGAVIAELCVVLLEMRNLKELAERLGRDTITLEGVSRKMQEMNWREPILEQGREQGLERGLEKGREQGLEQGRKELLAKQAEIRFGKQEARTLSRLLRSVESVGRLDEIGLWLVECDSFDALKMRLKAT